MKEPEAIGSNLTEQELEERRLRRNASAARSRARQSPEKKAARLAYNRAKSAEYRAAHPNAAREYEAANREAIAAKRKIWNSAHRDERAAYHKAYYAARGDEIKAHKRAIYAADPEPFKRYGKAYRAAHPEVASKARANGLRALYGLSAEQYAELMAAQEGLCAICGQPPRRYQLHVDHDHATGRIRGLLCASCNTALGRFRDDPAVMLRAVEYLRR